MQIGQQSLTEAMKAVCFHGTIHFAPPDLIRAGRVTHNEFVIRRAARMLSRPHHQRAEVGQACFTAADGLLVKQRRGEVPVHCVQVLDTMIFQAISAVNEVFCLHVVFL